MHDPLLLLPLLLVPVVALLFLNLRLSRRLRYPHELLRAEQRRGVASLFLRTLRGHYDVLVDAAIALALAFALLPAATTSAPAAVVIDGSRTMLAGYPGNRPLDLALQRLKSEARLRGARPFALVFDPAKRATRLMPLARLLAASHLDGVAPSSPDQTAAPRFDAITAAGLLEQNFTFFAPDYAQLATLRERGFGDITLLTDHARFRPEGFRVEEVGGPPPLAAYPTAVRYDRTSQSWLVVLAESGPELPLQVAQRKAEGFERLDSTRYAIEQAPGGRRVRLAAPGLYLLSLTAPGGGVDVDLPLLLAQRGPRAAAAGPFSQRMLSVFPLLEQSARPEVVLADAGFKAPAAKRVVSSLLTADDGESLIDPGLTEGALVAAGFRPGSDFVLGPSSLAQSDLVLAYDSLLRSGNPAFSTSVPRGSSLLTRAGSSFLAEVDGSLRPLIPPPSRLFELPAEGGLRLPPPERGRFGWFLLLAVLAAGKLALWKRFSGKRLFGTS